MSGLLLDTNIASDLVPPQPEQKVLVWLVAQRLDTLFLSSQLAIAPSRRVSPPNYSHALDAGEYRSTWAANREVTYSLLGRSARKRFFSALLEGDRSDATQREIFRQ